MLDLKFIRQNPRLVAEGIASKGVKVDIDGLLALDEKRRNLLAESEGLKAERNQANLKIAQAKSQGKPDPVIIGRMKEISARVKELDSQLEEIDLEIGRILLYIPNLPHESVPRGTSEADNKEVKRWGKPKEFEYTPRPHWEIRGSPGHTGHEKGGETLRQRVHGFYRRRSASRKGAYRLDD